MPVHVRFNTHEITVPPRLAQMILFLVTHQSMICQVPTCAVTFHCGAGAEVKGEFKVSLPKPTITLDKP